MLPKGSTKCTVTKEEFIEKLYEYNGCAYRVYTELKVPYSLYCKWRDEDPDFAFAIEDSKKKGIQFAENKMFDLIANGNEKMIRFLLSAKGGYTTKKEIVVDSKSVVDVNTAIDSIKQELENEPDK